MWSFYFENPETGEMIYSPEVPKRDDLLPLLNEKIEEKLINSKKISLGKLDKIITPSEGERASRWRENWAEIIFIHEMKNGRRVFIKDGIRISEEQVC
jgi:hypothetical protein